MFRLSPLLLAATACAAEHVVINEIHYDPADRQPLEFVELHNAGDRPARLAGWSLDKFKFPAEAEIAPGGFLVLARDPAAVDREFGVKSLGPLPGKLSNGGEKLTLRDASGKTVEQFRYGAGFPWPSAPAGLGSSLERIHPLLAPATPGHWRASGSVTPATRPAAPFIVPGSAKWTHRKGTSEASQPADAWRARDFRESNDWQPGKAGFGYADNDDATVLADMPGRYSSVYLRHHFTVEKPPAATMVRVRVDDGCIIWINGREAARFHAPAGEPRFDSVATDHEAGDWEEALIPNAAQFLTPGDNVVAVQAFNASRDSSDFSFDLALGDAATVNPSPKAGRRPTPGARNSVFAETAPPAFAAIRHDPVSPKPGEPVRISTLITNGPPRAVTLHVQVVEPGAYLRKTDPAYETQWQDFPMRADRSTWIADLPPDLQKNRRLIRYRITAENPDGSRTRIPLADDPSPNFAYYVWAGPTPWIGASQPGKTPPITFSADMQRTLPTFTLLGTADDVSRSQWDGSANHKRFLGTFIYEGRVLDHMEFNNRGSGSTYLAGKNKWGFHFQPTHDLPMRDQWGRPYGAAWNSFAMNPCTSPWVPINRGMAGLDEVISFRAYQLAGVPTSDSLPIHFRIVTTAQEQGATQYDTDLWGLYIAVEDNDGAWLDNKNLPDGIVYKMEDGVKHTPSGFTGKPQEVWRELHHGPRGGDAEKWWRTHLDLPAYYSFHAITRLVSNVDLRPGCNHLLYQHPERGWSPVPWDLDMQFIPRVHQAGHIDQIACLNVPALKIEYQNRAREVLDLLAGDATPDGGQIGQLVAEYARLIEPRGSTPDASWAALDESRWNYSPRTQQRGQFYRNPCEQGMFGGTFTRKLATPDFAGFSRFVVDFCTDSRPQKNYAPNDGNPLGYGYGHLLSECHDPNTPARPSIQQTAPLTFTSSAFSDKQGPATFTAIQWRIAEIARPAQGPWLYEINPLWISDPLPAIAPCIFPNLCQPGHTYRIRARHQDNTGRWGHWSAAVQFTWK